MRRTPNTAMHRGLTVTLALAFAFSFVPAWAAEKKDAGKKPAAEATQPAEPAKDAKKGEGKKALIDINSASKQKLMGISGIGDAYSDETLKDAPTRGRTTS
jgi:DNA uptake protein ComE-like DNA-binding protein